MFKAKRSLASVVVVLIIFGLSSSQTRSNLDIHESVLRARERHVSLLIKDRYTSWAASGVIIKSNLVLTNYHVIEKLTPKANPTAAVRKKIECMKDVEFSREYTDEIIEGSDLGEAGLNYVVKVNFQLAKIEFWDRNMDLLLLSVPTRKVLPVSIRTTPEIEEPVFSISDPRGKPPAYFSSGTILVKGNHGIISNVYAKPGASGSAIYSWIDGALLGIVTKYGGDINDEKCRCSFARNGADVLDFLKRAGVILE